jgi:AraC-like DNA-binding protein
MDPLSDVLSLLKPRSYMAGGFDAGGEWSVQYSGHIGIKCYALVSGQCWLAVEGVADAVQLKAGDCFLLPRGWPFRLASDLGVAPVGSETVYGRARNGSVTRDGGITRYNGGGDCFLVGSRFVLSGDHAGMLLEMLPPIVHIRKKSDQATLRWAVERMAQELREQQPGGFLVAEHLAHMVLVQALRLHLAEGVRGGVGWLFALADRQMGAAIGAMHADPARRWTVQALAERAGMSRSVFALNFKEMVGFSPMEYLTRWRMSLAGDRLANSGDSVAVIALALGYESESAFSTAFKRVMSCPPRHYRNGRTPLPVAQSERQAAGAGRLEFVTG